MSIKSDEAIFTFDAVIDKAPFVKKFYLVRKKKDIEYIESLKKLRDAAYNMFLFGVNDIGSQMDIDGQNEWNRRYQDLLKAKISLAGDRYTSEDIGYRAYNQWQISQVEDEGKLDDAKDNSTKTQYEINVLQNIEDQRNEHKLTFQEKLDRASKIYESEMYQR